MYISFALLVYAIRMHQSLHFKMKQLFRVPLSFVCSSGHWINASLFYYSIANAYILYAMYFCNFITHLC